jgi:hypothetical protein
MSLGSVSWYVKNLLLLFLPCGMYSRHQNGTEFFYIMEVSVKSGLFPFGVPFEYSIKTSVNKATLNFLFSQKSNKMLTRTRKFSYWKYRTKNGDELLASTI